MSYMKEIGKGLIAAPGVTFGYIGHYRYGRSLYLVFERKITAEKLIP
jgi:hypothetical protein